MNDKGKALQPGAVGWWSGRFRPSAFDFAAASAGWREGKPWFRWPGPPKREPGKHGSLCRFLARRYLVSRTLIVRVRHRCSGSGGGRVSV